MPFHDCENEIRLLNLLLKVENRNESPQTKYINSSVNVESSLIFFTFCLIVLVFFFVCVS